MAARSARAANTDGSERYNHGDMTPSQILPEQYGLLAYWSVAKRRSIWLLLPLVLFVGAAYLLAANQPATYRATAKVLLADTAAQRTLDPSSQNTGFLTRELANEISLATSDAVESLVIAELGDLPDVEITSDSRADVLIFEATSNTPDRAATDANLWARKYVEVKRDQAVVNITAATTGLNQRLVDLGDQRDALRAPLDDLDATIARTADPEVANRLQRDYDRLADDLRYDLEIITSQAQETVASLTDLELQAEIAAVGEARIIQVAAPPSTNSNPSTARSLVPGVLLGLIGGVALATLAEVRDNTIKSAADIQAITALPVLATVPLWPKRDRHVLGLATHQVPEGRLADSYHKLRSSIEFASLDSEIRSVLVTSPGPQEGKSASSSNLALAASSVGRRTVLLDVDFRRPTVHTTYGTPQSPGLSDYVSSGAELSSIAYSVKEPGLDNLLVIPIGTIPPNPAAFVGTDGFRATIGWMETQADLLILDGPPLLAVSEPVTLAQNVDAVVVTVMADSTTRAELRDTVTALSQVGATVLGVVLIGADEFENSDRYYRLYTAQPGPKGPHRDGALWGKKVARPTIDITAEAASERSEEKAGA